MSEVNTNPKVQQAIELVGVTGDEYQRQGLAMADILLDLNVDAKTVAAAIVCNSVLHQQLDIEDVKSHLGDDVASLVKHTQQLDAISELYLAVAHHGDQHHKVDNIRKMVLAMVNDIRAVLIKLASQVVLLRLAKNWNDVKRRNIAKETMAIYAPLANRLGIATVKWELEDLAFRYLNPEEYKEISKALLQKRVDREAYVKNFMSNLEQLLRQAGIHDMEISGRVKHIYSIYKKMQRKEVGFSEIYDATALRVMVPTLEDCYTVLSCVHNKWRHIPEEFDDYVANPKPNGYKSIHTAVVGPYNKNVEIQIRTYKMHEEAELGVAAHWIYKEGPQKGSDYEAKIAWLRQVMDWQQEVTHTEDLVQDVNKVFADRVYVFTPQGDVMDLPFGATVLDFAYHVHSDIGHRCKGGKVNGKIANLTYKLQTGDRVEVLTGKESCPSRDWMNEHLGFLHTARARAKVHNWFRKEDYERNLELGQDFLERELKRLHLKNFNHTELAKQLKYKDSESLYVALGSGELKLGTVINQLQIKTEAPQEETFVPIKHVHHKKTSNIDIQGVDNLVTNIANCCQPVPGEPIIGYITQGKGVTIHRQDCFNVLRAKSEKPERLIEVSWGDSAKSYPINLVVEANDRSGLIKDVINVLNSDGITLLGLNSGVNKREALAFLNLTVEVSDLELLDHVITKIQQLPDVIDVRR